MLQHIGNPTHLHTIVNQAQMETGLQSAIQGNTTQPIPLFRPNELAIILVPLTAVLQDVIGLALVQVPSKENTCCLVSCTDFSSQGF